MIPFYFVGVLVAFLTIGGMHGKPPFSFHVVALVVNTLVWWFAAWTVMRFLRTRIRTRNS